MKQLLIWLHSCSLSDWRVCFGKNSIVLLAENRVMVFTCVSMWEWVLLLFGLFSINFLTVKIRRFGSSYFVITEDREQRLPTIVFGKTELSPRLPFGEKITLIILMSASPCCNIPIFSVQTGLEIGPVWGQPVYVDQPVTIFNAIAHFARVTVRNTPELLLLDLTTFGFYCSISQEKKKRKSEVHLPHLVKWSGLHHSSLQAARIGLALCLLKWWC